MQTLYDVQQLLKQFGIYIYIGVRLYDIELMQIELKKIYEAQLIARQVYMQARGVLQKEYMLEEKRRKGIKDK